MTMQSSALLFLATSLSAIGQQPSAILTVGQRAVVTVLHQSGINPFQFVEGTKAPLSSQGKWSVAKTPAEGCAASTECVKTIYTVSESNIVCEWTVQLSAGDNDGVILDENDSAEKYLLHRLKPEEATALILHSESAVFPPIARAAHVSGVVKIGLTVTKEGMPKSVNAYEGPDMLKGSAVDAAKKWTFKPLLLNGKPISWTSTDLTFKFGLSPSSPGLMPVGKVEGTFSSRK